jgi:hypothetical protein
MTPIHAMPPSYCTRNFFPPRNRNNVSRVVLNAGMKRHPGIKSLVAAALVVSAALPGIASAKLTELGSLADNVRGSCPLNCQALTRTTGYQAKVGTDRQLYQAPVDGRIVAWSLALGKPGPKQTAFFEERYGGTSQAAIVVLDTGKKLGRTVVSKSPLQKLTDYFGQSVQFPLAQTLPIKKGQYVALTVPTWAPTFQIGLGSDTSWRSSRAQSGCLDVTTQFALVGKRSSAFFRCLYKGVRLTYSATFVSDPTATPTR